MNCNDFKIGMRVYNSSINDGELPLTVYGIRETEIEVGCGWLPIDEFHLENRRDLVANRIIQDLHRYALQIGDYNGLPVHTEIQKQEMRQIINNIIPKYQSE